MNDKQQEYQEYIEFVSGAAYDKLVKYEDVDVDIKEETSNDMINETIGVDEIIDQLLEVTSDYNPRGLILDVLKGKPGAVDELREKYNQLVQKNIDIFIKGGR